MPLGVRHEDSNPVLLSTKELFCRSNSGGLDGNENKADPDSVAL